MGKGRAVHRQNKPQGHKALAAADKNIRNVVAFLEGGPKAAALFPARISANRGSYFQLVFHDGEAVTDGVLLGSPCGTFVAGGKPRVRMATGDIVLVEGSQKARECRKLGKTLVVDIVGHLSKRYAQLAFRSGRMHKAVYGKDEAEDELFDYSEEEDEEDEGSDGELEVTKKRGKARAKKATGAAGRGSGGKTGLGGIVRPNAHATVRDALEDTAYAAAVVAHETDGPDEEEMRMLRAFAREEPPDAPVAGGSNAAGPGGPVPLVASPLRERSGFGLYEAAAEEEAPLILRKGAVPENWEDEDDLDIDNI